MSNLEQSATRSLDRPEQQPLSGVAPTAAPTFVPTRNEQTPLFSVDDVDWNGEYQRLLERLCESPEDRLQRMHDIGALCDRFASLFHSPAQCDVAATAVAAPPFFNATHRLHMLVGHTGVFPTVSGCSSSRFMEFATPMAQTIIREEGLAVSAKTIKPLSAGGIAGGEKFLHRNVFLKFCRDWKNVYGSEEMAMKSASRT
jgi:hypothetical protein